MVEYCEEDFETQNRPPAAAEEVQVDPPPPAAAEEVVAESPLRNPPSAAEEVQIELPSRPPASDVQIQNLNPPATAEVQIEILDVVPGDCCDGDPKRRMMAKGTKAYCLSCRKKTSMHRPRLVKMKKGQRLAGSCKNCSTKTSLIISKNHQFAVK